MLYDVKGEAAKFRSKCLWVEQSERPIKYFFNLGLRMPDIETINKALKLA